MNGERESRGFWRIDVVNEVHCQSVVSHRVNSEAAECGAPCVARFGAEVKSVDAGLSVPAVGKKRNDIRFHGCVYRARTNCGNCTVGDNNEFCLAELSEVGSPVNDCGYARTAGVQYETGARGPEINDCADVLTLSQESLVP